MFHCCSDITTKLLWQNILKMYSVESKKEPIKTFYKNSV